MITGIDEVLTFNQLTLADESWIQETYPEYSNNAGLERVDLKMFCTILYRVLDNKEAFAAIERDTHDSDGVAKKEKIGGVNLLLEKIKGDQGKIDVMETFTAVCLMSRKEGEAESSETVKKKRKLNQLIFGNLLYTSLLTLVGACLILKIFL